MVTAVILAGGLGTRLREAVPNLPKPMAPVMGKPFLEILLDYWIKQGVNDFIISIGYKGEIISSYFGKNYNGKEISYAVEDEPRGTGGGLLLALERIPKKTNQILVLNGDTFIDINLKDMIAEVNRHNADWGIAVFESTEPNRYMTLESNKDGEIVELNKNISQDINLSNGGVYLVKAQALKNLGVTYKNQPISLEADILPLALIKKQKIYSYATTGRFLDIGIPNDYFSASKIL
jgi:D-glycero-alpha-D-manno-heptose 1-phosphate guanylyltransferase